MKRRMVIAGALLVLLIGLHVTVGRGPLGPKLWSWAVAIPFLMASSALLLRSRLPLRWRVMPYFVLVAVIGVVSEFVELWSPGPQGKWEFPATWIDWLLVFAGLLVTSAGFCGAVALMAWVWDALDRRRLNRQQPDEFRAP